MKDTKAKQMKPIAAACRIPDNGIFIIRIGKSNDKKIIGLGCRLANEFIPIKKIALVIMFRKGCGISNL